MPVCGIYKITNLINGHCYIGQSRNIKQRWKDHRSRAFNISSEQYEYPLYRAFRKYGLENFSFEILEKCSLEELNEKESLWIRKIKPAYNQTIGGDHFEISYSKLTFQEVNQIKEYLFNAQQSNKIINLKNLAQEYNVSYSTIAAINTGRAWIEEQFDYPIYTLSRTEKYEKHCPICGKIIQHNSSYCSEHKISKLMIDKSPEAREQMKNLIRQKTFVQIGKELGLTESGVRGRCKAMGLPFRKRDINSYSDEEWNNL